MSNPIPNLPPISAVQDPAVKSYLEALTNAWLVRNGQVGDGGEKFLTVNDLKAGVNLASSAYSQNGFTPSAYIYPASKYSIGAVSDIFANVTGQLANTAIWKKLTERIDKIETPQWFQGKLGSDVQTEITKLTTTTEALATKTDTAVANLSGNLALAQTQLTAVSEQTASHAESITQLQANAGQGNLTAEERLSIQNSADAIEGSWTVKFDANGYVVGAGLGLEGKNGNYTSAFVIQADSFAIKSPLGDYSPFIVTGNDVYMNSNLLVGGSTLGDMANSRSLISIGSYASPPGTLNLLKNSVYRNTVDGNTYILNSDGGAWELWLTKGADGVSQGVVKGICFLRSATAPATPTGGSYATPVATNWYDGVPSGTTPLYMTSRTFTSDGAAPQDAAWAPPSLVSATGQGTKVQFSLDGSTSWHDTPVASDQYMRTGISTDGGTTWTYDGAVKIKGEQGPQGLQGLNGQDGVAGTSYWLTTSVPAIQKTIAGVYTPSSVTFSAMSATGTADPAAYSGRFIISTTNDGTNYADVYTSAANESSKAYTIPANIKAVRARLYKAGGTTLVLDEQILTIVTDGAAGTAGVNGIMGALTNEAHSVPADSSGNVQSFVGASTTMYVYNGTTDDSANWSFNAVKTNCACSEAATSRTQTLVSLSADVGYVDITATRSGYSSITKRFTIAKAKQGQQGAQGSAGANGSNGSDGARGSLMVSHPGSYSSNGQTSTDFQTQSGGRGYGSDRIMGDTVSYANSGNYYRTANNTDNWAQAQLYVHGNAIVTGTLYANRIVAGSLTKAYPGDTYGSGTVSIATGQVTTVYTTGMFALDGTSSTCYVLSIGTASAFPVSGTADLLWSLVLKKAGSVVATLGSAYTYHASAAVGIGACMSRMRNTTNGGSYFTAGPDYTVELRVSKNAGTATSLNVSSVYITIQQVTR